MEEKSTERKYLWRQVDWENSKSQRNRSHEAEAHSQHEVRSKQVTKREMCISVLGHEAVLGEEMVLWNPILSQKKGHMVNKVSNQQGAWN